MTYLTEIFFKRAAWYDLKVSLEQEATVNTYIKPHYSAHKKRVNSTPLTLWSAIDLRSVCGSGKHVPYLREDKCGGLPVQNTLS